MPSMGDMQQYGMHGLPFTTGPQIGHVSSMTSTPGGQHSMDSTGWPLLPPYPFQNSGQDEALTIDGIHQRFRGLETTGSIDSNSCKLILTCPSHAHQMQPTTAQNTETEREDFSLHRTQHSSSQNILHRTLFTRQHIIRCRRETGPKAATRHNPPTPLVRCAKGVSNPCTRHRPSGGDVHDAALSPAPPHHSLIPCCKSNLIILHEHQSTILTYPARFRPARRWRLPQ